MNKKLLALSFGILGLGSLLNAQEQVGINTTTPNSTLQVNGDMNIRKLGAFTTDATPLAWNSKTKKITEGRAGNNVVTYTFNARGTSSYGGNVLADINTGVSADKYELYVIDYLLENERNGIKEYDTHVGLAHVRWSYDVLNPLVLIDTKIVDGVWHILARTTATDNNSAYGPYYWDIETMILPKRFADHIDVEGEVTEDSAYNYQPRGSMSFDPLANYEENKISASTKELNYEEQQGNVGINKKDPKATLHVGGDVAINTVDVASTTDDVTFVGRNNTTGEIVPYFRKGKKPIYKVVFYTPTDGNATHNNDRDRVNFYDTKIPVKDYYIVINRSTFVAGNSLSPTVPITHETTGGSNYNPSKFVTLTREKPDGTISDTWGLRLDYINAGPDPNFKDPMGWLIETLVFSNEFLKNIDSENLVDGHSKEAFIDNNGNATTPGTLNGLPQ